MGSCLVRASAIEVPTATFAAQGAAPERVYNDEEREEGNVHDGHCLPFLLGGLQHAGLARVALEAKHLLVVAPCPAVTVAGRRRRQPRPRGLPERGVHVPEPAPRRRLAATRLHRRMRTRMKPRSFQFQVYETTS